MRPNWRFALDFIALHFIPILSGTYRYGYPVAMPVEELITGYAFWIYLLLPASAYLTYSIPASNLSLLMICDGLWTYLTLTLTLVRM